MRYNTSSIAFLKQRLPILVLLMSVACAQGCASYQVRILDSDPLAPQYEGRTMHAFFWGLVMDPEVMIAKDSTGRDAEAINDVVIKGNYLNSLISVVTLGIWMPMEVEYRSRAPDIDGGEFPD